MRAHKLCSTRTTPEEERRRIRRRRWCSLTTAYTKRRFWVCLSIVSSWTSRRRYSMSAWRPTVVLQFQCMAPTGGWLMECHSITPRLFGSLTLSCCYHTKSRCVQLAHPCIIINLTYANCLVIATPMRWWAQLRLPHSTMLWCCQQLLEEKRGHRWLEIACRSRFTHRYNHINACG